MAEAIVTSRGPETAVILSVSAGTGHMQAARAIELAMQELSPATRVVTLDTFKYTTPLLEKLILGTYMEMLRLSPQLYGYLYQQSERGRLLAGTAKQEFNRLLNRFTAGKLIGLIESLRPGIILCTHPFPLGVMDALRSSGLLTGCLLAGVITDFTVHAYWVFEHVDIYIVGTPELVGEFAAFGIDSRVVRPVGIPVLPAFASQPDRTAARAALGLDLQLPVLLLMGGGLGMGAMLDVATLLGHADLSCQIVCIAGRNTVLQDKLSRMAPELRQPLHVVGYTEQVPLYMAASDLLISKAGGLTCAEALASGLPMVVVSPLPGQEERNAQFLAAAGAGVYVKKLSHLLPVLQDIFRSPGCLARMADAARRYGRPRAAYDSVQCLLQGYAAWQAVAR
ncbi:MAG: MGDG synthase family glycosyltransferase [Desulfurispora sp.]|uniref:MGDG synthase family glycosyltransferase n=1 Tax=Desulfurispora sp. TaxID=3014275 RepID=UPI00404B1E9B